MKWINERETEDEKEEAGTGARALYRLSFDLFHTQTQIRYILNRPTDQPKTKRKKINGKNTFWSSR